MAQLQKFANVLWICVLCGVVLSGSVYQLIMHEDPCPLCLLERLGMMGTAVALLLNLRFGIRAEHYALAILASIGGRFVSLRQIALHICPQFPVFGTPVFGYDLYVWAYIVFNCSVIAGAILLMIFGFTDPYNRGPSWDSWGKSAAGLLVCVLLINLITVFDLCGLSPCAG
jgi:disulfide bond formation protein DsbB